MADEPDATPEKQPVDLRFTSVEQSGVSINRDLSGQGHLARGSRTNMSNMRFSVRAQPRDEPDPELLALRPSEPADAERAAPAKREYAPPAVPAPVAPVPAAPIVAASESPAAPDTSSGGGVFGAIKRLFS